MLIEQWIQGLEEGYQSALALRKSVFIDEQGFPAECEPDAIDAIAMHLLLYDAEAKHHKAKLIATGRLFQEDQAWLIGRICVHKDHRHKRYGEMLTQKLCQKAFEMDPLLDVIAHAQTQAEAFYQKIGFKSFGAVFLEEGQPHIMMRKNASA